MYMNYTANLISRFQIHNKIKFDRKLHLKLKIIAITAKPGEKLHLKL
jgi:hypothetical protein